jgi:pyridoxamine 5'-phosphate oxidase
MTIAFRSEYNRGELNESDLDPDPIRQFRAWFEQAVSSGLPEPNAMTLATATLDGKPSARIVLLKAFDSAGFTFHTSYDSRKGRELESNPHAALVLFWPELERQVRIEGKVGRVSEAESDEYFASRPPGSRLGACASRQSAVVAGRHVFEDRVKELLHLHPDGLVPRPPTWGGYRLAPETLEFWQGRANRLHDRLRYRREGESAWAIERLAP